MPDPAPAPADAPDLTGRTLGDFQVLRKLGQGGMGQVYLARQLSLKREVALKILNRDLAENATALKRFQAEAEAVARVTHANIVQVYAIGEEAGVRYMALEYVDGRNLRDYLARRGPPDLPVALAIMRQVAAALQRASEIGIVHRDIKPENILVTRKVEVKVADFGLSRYFAGEGQPLSLTQSGVTLGTPLYMSPEQVQGQPVDHRSDVYSFGVTCYHLLAGHPPFAGATAFDVAVQHVQNTPPPLSAVRPDLPADLCAIVHKMMAKRPADRYQTAREILRDLARVQKGVALGMAAPPELTFSGQPVPTLPVIPAPGAPTVGMSSSGVSAVSPSAATVYVPVPTSGLRWALRAAGVVGLALLALGGWWAYSLTHRPAEPKGPPSPGLPEARLPEPVVSARERELKGKIESRASRPDEVFEAYLELGLLYVRERRLDDADRVFKELEQERGGPKAALPRSQLAGRLGEAVVLAMRDKADDSNKLFIEIVPPAARGRSLLETFLLAHPDFGQAVANALNRNAENLNRAKLADKLEWLRTPSGLAKGPKGG